MYIVFPYNVFRVLALLSRAVEVVIRAGDDTLYYLKPE